MNERQRDLFLWQWSRRRNRGRVGGLLLGLGIGAAGGLLFAILMYWAMTFNGRTFGLNEDEMAPFFLWLGRRLGPAVFLFVVSIPPFALLGAFLAHRAWGMLEDRYHALLNAGARTPDEKPTLTLKERAPHLVVLALIGLLVLGGFFGLWWEVTRGAL